MEPLTSTVTRCAIDKSDNLSSLLEMPNFPLTEFYGQYDPDLPNFNQTLLICDECGHVQLGKHVESRFLYQPENYNFRTITSSKILSEMDFLKNFILGLPIDTKNFSVLEFGANNLVLGIKIKHLFKDYAVCDPILKELENNISNIEVIDKFIENYVADASFINHNLILGRHVLEHIADPITLIENIFSKSREDVIFVFEVPSFHHLRKKMRFDSVIHQHLHYFDAHSVYRLVDRVNGELLSLKYNSRGSNGGSLLFSFIIKREIKRGENLNYFLQDNTTKKNEVLAEIRNFRLHFEIVGNQLLNSGQPLIGYGASHMLSTFNYHSLGIVEKLEFILDDDLQKINLKYKNLQVNISHPTITSVPKEAIFCITSLENQREILYKVISTYPNNLTMGLIV
jgi:hypothetical protein